MSSHHVKFFLDLFYKHVQQCPPISKELDGVIEKFFKDYKFLKKYAIFRRFYNDFRKMQKEMDIKIHFLRQAQLSRHRSPWEVEDLCDYVYHEQVYLTTRDFVDRIEGLKE